MSDNRILRNAIAEGVQQPEALLRLSQTLVRRKAVPPGTLRIVLRDAEAVRIHAPEGDLRGCVFLLGGEPKLDGETNGHLNIWVLCLFFG